MIQVEGLLHHFAQLAVFGWNTQNRNEPKKKAAASKSPTSDRIVMRQRWTQVSEYLLLHQTLTKFHSQKYDIISDTLSEDSSAFGIRLGR